MKIITFNCLWITNNLIISAFERWRLSAWGNNGVIMCNRGHFFGPGSLWEAFRAMFSNVQHMQYLEERRARKWGNSYVYCLVITSQQKGAPSQKRKHTTDLIHPHLEKNKTVIVSIYLLWSFLSVISRDTKRYAVHFFFCLQINNNSLESRRGGTKLELYYKTAGAETAHAAENMVWYIYPSIGSTDEINLK